MKVGNPKWVRKEGHAGKERKKGEWDGEEEAWSGALFEARR